jgi:orotate phosphoribosyltransferase
MNDYQIQFLQLCLEYQVLQFGEFTLKSGRKSPYFFNLGKISDGKGWAMLADCYARCIYDNFLKFDKDIVLFGPAYKGIPLCTTIAQRIFQLYDINVPTAYNRKEAKDHGEGGILVGTNCSKRKILIVDDVLTAGSAVREVVGELNKLPGVKIVGLTIALDRKEIVSQEDRRSALTKVKQDMDMPVHSIIDVGHIVKYLEELYSSHNEEEIGKWIENIRSYQKSYSANE